MAAPVSVESTSQQPWTESLKIKAITENVNIHAKNENESNRITFSIVSFNVLAESYLTPRSHKNLPDAAANVVFDKQRRRKLLCDTLTKLAETFDILCLQELDDALQDLVFKCLSRLGYGYVYAPRGGVPISSSDVDVSSMGSKESNNSGATQRMADGSNVRSDGCATFYDRSKWKCVNYQVVNFDDLAEEDRPLLNANTTENVTAPAKPAVSIASTAEPVSKRKKGYHALAGIIASYRRRNAALLMELEQLRLPQKTRNIIVANAHLYWHPGYEYVKLSQAHYLLHRVKQFSLASSLTSTSKINNGGEREPVVLVCGDMNSKPYSVVHKYFTTGGVDARAVAPWHFPYDGMEEEEELVTEMKSLGIDSDHVEDEDVDQDPVVVDIDDDEDQHDTCDEDDVRGLVDERNDLLPSVSVEKSSSMNLPAYESDDAAFGLSDSSGVPPVRYLLDINLNKFTRWLRILGLDATLETVEEEKLRTGEGQM